MVLLASSVLVLSLLGAYGDASPLASRSPKSEVCTPTAVRYIGATANKVESFLNIRFGEDTSGANRFAPPKPYTYAVGTVVDASRGGAACPQPKQAVASMPLFDNVTKMSEDCLTLRIDRPVNTSASAKLPVLVWIYGGGDSFGQIYDSAYDPTGLVLGAAEKDFPVIYVAMNYRVGVFGFAASPALNATDSLNVGLLDQRLAIEWVRDHIAAFGGDPDNVTIFGESDGATGVGLQITAYGGKGGDAPFRRAIMQSGSPMADPGTASNKSAEHTSQLTKITNCTASTPEAELKCLRNIPMKTLNSLAVEYERQVGGEDGMDVFIPISPSTFIPDSPSKLVATGQFSRNIDIISGWNEDDGSFSIPTTIATDKDLALFVKYEYALFSTEDIERVLALYPASAFSSRVASLPAVNKNNITEHYFRASQIKRDAEFSCASLYLAQMNHKYSTYETRNYLFALNQTLFRDMYAAVNMSYLGVSHFSDIPYVFNQAQGYGEYASAKDLALSAEVSGSWAAFAALGQPSHGPGTVPGWESAFENGNYQLQVIGGSYNGTRITGPSQRGGYEDLAAKCAFWTSEDILAKLQV
ncbi:Alpha/Beta hydrolase protein [Aspergillus insuetus]